MLEELKSVARRVGSDRQLRALQALCQRLLSERGEASSVTVGRDLLAHFEALSEAARDRFFDFLARELSPDPQALLVCAQAYAKAPTAANLRQLSIVAEPPRQELLRRLNRLPGGTAHIIAMRQALLARLPRQPALAAVEDDFLHLLGSWFNPGFLQLQRVDWRSPAQLLEQLICHEAVHAIDGWEDLRRRLQPDRRCFAFFHPQLPDEPLIFVEVALLAQMPAAVAPLIDKSAEPQAPSTFKTAVFYSISNCQPGLKGVSLGNFLIKRVADALQQELPQIKSFCTLSPIPGLSRWLREGAVCEGLTPWRAQRLTEARQAFQQATGGTLPTKTPVGAGAQALQRLAAFYLAYCSPREGGDPVARFHLDNGARLERLNPAADVSPKGQRQSLGMMVNYLYDLDKVARHHESFVRGDVAHGRQIAALL